MLNKKRGSHVGLILSFTIFIMFIVFLYTVINPMIKKFEGKESVLDSVKVKILENISEKVTIVSILGDSGDWGNYKCFELNSSELGVEGLNSIVKDNERNVVDSENDSNLHCSCQQIYFN